MGGLRQQASTLALEVCSRCTRNPIQVSLLQARLVTILVATTVAGTQDRFILAAIESSTCAAKGGLCTIRSHRSARIVLISAPADMMTSTMSLLQARQAILGAKTTWWNAGVSLATCVLADGATGLRQQASTLALEVCSRCTRNPIQVSLLQARLVTILVATTVAGTKDRFIVAAIESSTCAAKGGLCMI